MKLILFVLQDSRKLLDLLTAWKEAGGSIPTRVTSCSRWFWNISRSTPTLS